MAINKEMEKTIMRENKEIDYDRILKFLPYFEDEYFRFLYGERGFTCIFSDDIAGFVNVLREDGFFISFKWQEWQEEAGRYIDNPELILEAPLEDLRKLLTTFVERDKVKLGYLISVIRDELVLLILKRLKVLVSHVDRC
ncbi:MAG: hypothetical protein GXZ07_03085 [Firmicutes bacterium]|nr:hypothetical protein [Bacillota bacterium]